MALTFLKLSCVMLLMMMMVMVPEAVPHRPHRNMDSHHKTTTSPKDNSPKYFLMNMEHDIKLASRAIQPINNDSISPWKYISTVDSNRIPNQLFEARCLLTGCLNHHGIETLEFQSRQIYRQIPVLQRVRGDDKNYYFRVEYKIVSVGCTCVRPHVEHI